MIFKRLAVYMEDSKVNEVGSVISPVPTDMAVQTGPVVGRDRLIVSDTNPNNRILGVSLLSPITRVLATFGQGPGQVDGPTGIAVDPNTRNIFVVDGSNDRVQKFSPNFVFIKEWGSRGIGNSQFSVPKGIAIDSNGDVYVVDFGNHRVQKFDNDGVFIKVWGQRGTGNSEFNLPFGIAVESDDDIVVTDRDNNRIQKFKSDSQFIRSWGKPGTGNGEFNNPLGVAVDSNDDNYVVDAGNHRVQKFDRNGVFIKAWGSPGSGDGQFNEPVGITFNRLNGTLLVSDFANRNIQVFTTDGVFSGKVQFDIVVHP
jgi:tripartite motif-containing protein 71